LARWKVVLSVSCCCFWATICCRVGFLLGFELQDESLIDALERSKFGVLCRILRLRSVLQSRDVGLALLRVGTNRAERLYVAGGHRIVQVGRRTLSCDLLLRGSTKIAVAIELS
jgi:hypothetical protein